MTTLQQEAYQKLKKSDALTFLKEVSNSMTSDEFIQFSYVVMKSAYDLNRHKAVKYMLSFFPMDEPSLIAKIHLQVMLENYKDLNNKREINMLEVLAPHFSSSIYNETIEVYLNSKSEKNRPLYAEKEAVIRNTLLKINLPNNKKSLPRLKL